MMEVVVTLYIGRYRPWLEFVFVRLINALFGVVGVQCLSLLVGSL